MAQTTIEVRTFRTNGRWKGVLTMSGPGLQAPLDFYAQSDLRDVLGFLKQIASDKATVQKANEASVRKVQAELFENAKAFLQKNPSALGASNGWTQDALTALEKSVGIVSSSRAGNVDAKTLVASSFNMAPSSKEALKSAKMIYEAAKLLDTGRATLTVKVDGDVVGQMSNRRALPARRSTQSTSGLVAMEAFEDPFWSTPYPVDYGGVPFKRSYEPYAAYY
jgi:hypothetical protein